jgi:23S rRNA (cytosine1962-C5)-methyltransferase
VPAERQVRCEHPWVFNESIKEQNRDGETGELAVIFDRSDKFLAVGLYDAQSPIRVRILHAGKPIRITPEWWQQRVQAAFAKRRAHFDERTTGYRCINGESDGFSGMVVDRYADVLVMKLYSLVWMPRLNDLVSLLLAESGANAVVLRLSRNIHEEAARVWQRREGLIHGHCEPTVVFRENDILFGAQAIVGQKTGFYLDQRENRARVGEMAAGKDVLNVFSFSGGFSLYAARGGARSVADLDISGYALESARSNFALNDWAKGVPHECIQADAFEYLRDNTQKSYDLIVCDPPSMAKRAADVDNALRAYRALSQACAQRLRPGGLLVAASCSAHISEVDFHRAIETQYYQVLWTAQHAVDHPATFPEANYLKAIALRSR